MRGLICVTCVSEPSPLMLHRSGGWEGSSNVSTATLTSGEFIPWGGNSMIDDNDMYRNIADNATDEPVA